MLIYISNKMGNTSVTKVSGHTGLYAGEVRGGSTERTPYFCSLKLILSLNIKY